MANDIRVYGMLVNLKNRLELDAEHGKTYSKAQLSEAMRLINEINAILDRRVKR